MFFFFPVGTDAPVYHWPFGTVGLIAANILAFIAALAGAIDPTAGWLLEHGAGLHPEQWVLSVFMHAGFGHLIGNMLFLWVFGLVVEGKLGWMRFLACYLLIGVGESAIEQVLMLGHTGEPSFSVGASTAIYGIMAMAAVWAPKNEISLWYFAWFFYIFVGTVEVAIGWLAAIYIGLDLAWLIFLGGSMSSSWLHIAGVVIGFPLGVIMLKRGVVDCEGWDMFHVWSGDEGGLIEKQQAADQAAQRRAKKQSKQAGQQRQAASEQICTYVAAGNGKAAYTLYDKMRQQGLEILLGGKEIGSMIKGLHEEQRWAESAPLLVQLIALSPTRADSLRLKLAQICVVELGRPGRALDLIAAVDAEALPEQHRQFAAKIARRAHQMQSEGFVELDDDNW